VSISETELVFVTGIRGWDGIDCIIIHSFLIRRCSNKIDNGPSGKHLGLQKTSKCNARWNSVVFYLFFTQSIPIASNGMHIL
jgi:hypothetical protein